MPHSYDFFDKAIFDFVATLGASRVLDVGPGAGKYGKLLGGSGRVVHAVEIFAPYVSLFRLTETYAHVFVGNVMQFPFQKRQYDLVVLGDVLEHLSVPDAQALLSTLRKNHLPTLITVPYMYPHPPMYGNQWEEHKQSDLTKEVFNQRYPGFTLLFGNDKQGVYYRSTLIAMPSMLTET